MFGLKMLNLLKKHFFLHNLHFCIPQETISNTYFHLLHVHFFFLMEVSGPYIVL